MFDALDVGLEVVVSVRDVVSRLQRFDRDLASQLRRAVSSVALNVSEGSRRQGRDRLHLFRIAAGSADEARSALRLAQAWGHVDADMVRESLDLLDRELAMLYRLSH